MNRIGSVLIDVAHSNAGTIALRSPIDKEVGKGSMCIGHLGSGYCQQYTIESRATHCDGSISIWEIGMNPEVIFKKKKNLINK